MYQAYGLLQPATDFSLAAAAKKLAPRFPGFSFEQQGDKLTISKDDWEIHLELNSGPEVLEQSGKFAEDIEGAEHGGAIATCARRVEISSDFPDPEMDHFEDYLSVIEVLKSFKGVIAIDPSEPALL